MNNLALACVGMLFIEAAMPQRPVQAAKPGPGLPPHRAQHVTGVHAYAPHSVAAGEEIVFHASSTVDYRFSLLRLGADPHSAAQDEQIHAEKGVAAAQPIFPGSYVHIDKPLGAASNAITISCWVRPFRVAGLRQAIVAQRRDDAVGGFGLFLSEGALELECGPQGEQDAVRTKPKIVAARKWHHLAAAFDMQTTKIWLNGQLVAEKVVNKRAGSLATDAPLRLGASGVGEVAGHFFDGDIACCEVYGRVLSTQQIRKIHRLQGLQTSHEPQPLAFWDFAEEQGWRLHDRTGNGHDGRIVNQGMWMIGGPSFDAASVGKYDAAYDPRRDADRGHALRLASDDLYDCRWPIAHRVRMPKDSPSGFYCGRFEYETDGEPRQHNVTFVVRAAEDAPPPPILVLAATNTWRAYNWYAFADNQPPGRHNWGKDDVSRLTGDHSLPRYCMYHDHNAGQPTYKVGLNLPCESGDPYRCYRGSDIWGQWAQNERLAHLWLDRHRYAYEVITDMDLHRTPERLHGRKVLLIVGHSEYWSARAYDAVQEFLETGGNVIVLSANSMFWRVDFDDAMTTMHCRKFGEGMLGSAWTMPGELYHGPSASRGGLLRFCGKPAWAVIGLETAGWCDGMDFLPYTVADPDHFLFQRPNKVGLKEGDTFGFFKEIGMVGHEYDVRPSILVAATPNMPTGYEDIRDPPGMQVLAVCKTDRKIADYHADENMHRENPSGVCSEILYWQRPEGGRVFNIGSVAAPWGLYYDQQVGLLVQNVLHHFGVRPRQN